MSELLLKSFKWSLIALFVVIGFSAFMIADRTDSVKPIMIGILSFGIVYVLSIYFKNFRGKLLFWSVAVFVALTVASNYVPLGFYILFGWNPSYFDPYITWAGTVLLGGMPIMMPVFKKFD